MTSGPTPPIAAPLTPPPALPGLAGVRGEQQDPQALRRDDVITGDAVRLDLRPAGMLLRSGAWLMDALLIIIGLVGLRILIGLLLSSLESAYAAALELTVVVLGLLVYPIALETLTHGRSLGKIAFGLRVVRDDAGPIRMRHAMIRGLTALAECWTLIAVLISLLNRRGKRLGDLLAGTYVVLERPPRSTLVPVQMPPQLAGWAASTDLARIPDTTAAAARQLLGRLPRLTPDSAQHLLREMSGELATYVAPLPPPGTPAAMFIAAVLAERRSRDYARLSILARHQADRQQGMHTLPFGLD